MDVEEVLPDSSDELSKQFLQREFVGLGPFFNFCAAIVTGFFNRKSETAGEFAGLVRFISRRTPS